VGTGQFTNLTQGKQESDLRSTVRAIGFSGDGSEIWYRGAGQRRRPRLTFLTGGDPRFFLGERVAYMAWSPDGARLVYHTNEAGDPIFVANRTGADAQQIFAGGHNHDQTWSRDGKWIYYSKAGGAIWKVPVDGGEETPVVDSGSIYNAFAVCVTTSGIYFAGSPDPASGTAPLKLYRFADGKTVELGHFDKPLSLHLSVSPDEKWLLYTQLDGSVDDVVLIENFR